MRKFYLLIFLCLFFFLFNAVSYADVFSYTTYTYDENDTAQKAKIDAIENGRYKALLYVLKKITLAKDFPKIQEVFTPESSNNYSKGFSISDENIENKTYSANITFNFAAEAIYNTLNQNNIRYIRKKEDRFLIVPILTQKKARTVNSLVNNPWSMYWLNVKSDDYLSDLIYYNPPQGVDFLNNKKALDDLKYNADIKDVFILTLDAQDNGFYGLTVYSFSNKKTYKVENLTSIEDAQAEADIIIEQESSEKLIKLFDASNVEDNFKFVYINFGKWLIMNKALDEIVNDYKIKEIGPNYTIVSLNYPDSLDQLKSRFLENCIFLDEEALSFYMVKDCS